MIVSRGAQEYSIICKIRNFPFSSILKQLEIISRAQPALIIVSHIASLHLGYFALPASSSRETVAYLYSPTLGGISSPSGRYIGILRIRRVDGRIRLPRPRSK